MKIAFSHARKGFVKTRRRGKRRGEQQEFRRDHEGKGK